MIMNKFIFGVCTLMLVLASCKKDEPTPEPTPTPTTNPSGFTPPTTNYWEIGGLANDGSANILSCGLNASHTGLSKHFPSPINGFCHISFDAQDGTDIRSQITEGGYKAFNIAKKRELGAWPTGDSIAVNLTVEDFEGSDAAYYYYVAQGGKLYISKLNGKLRYTTDGSVNMIGSSNADINSFAFNTTVHFSWAEE